VVDGLYFCRMNFGHKQSLEGVFVIGINHKQLNVAERSKYSLSAQDQYCLAKEFKNNGFDSVIILNTCNRTEFYGCGDILLCKNIIVSYYQQQREIASYVFSEYQSQRAVSYILSVVVGLESQIVGDTEILGQFKKAVKFSKTNGLLTGYLERLANSAVQAAKEARTTTQISNGTVSLSYMAIKFLKELETKRDVKLMLIGLGKFGKSIAQNIKVYLPNYQITLTNRTIEKAEKVALELGIDSVPMDIALSSIRHYDVIISCVHIDNSFLIHREHVSAIKNSLICLDLSVPVSIDPSISDISNIKVFGLEDLTKEIENTIDDRRKEIPIAANIVSKIANEFVTWSHMFDASESLQYWQNQVFELGQTCSKIKGLENAQRKIVMGQQISDFVRYVKQNAGLCQDKNLIIKAYIEDRKEFIYESEKQSEGIIRKIKCKVCQGNC